jgi:hypothetical protein
MGLGLRLDADSELYLLLLARVPAAILGAAFIVETARCRFARVPLASFRRGLGGRVWLWLAGGSIATAILVQAAVWAGRNYAGFSTWLAQPPPTRIEHDLQELAEALLWVRRNTEPGAVLIANACTAPNLRADHWDALDHTLAGVHYYYSAISERRILVEGPNYLWDAGRARERLELASSIFYRGALPPANLVGTAPWYLLRDHKVRDAAPVSLASIPRAFANSRIEIYRLPSPAAAVAVASD